MRRLFAFDFSSSDPRVSLLSYTSETKFNAAGFTLNVNFDDKFDSAKVTNNYTFTETDAKTTGPALDGISAIAFAQTVPTGNAYRYSYDGAASETLTVFDLTNGTSQAIDITTVLDAAAITNGPGGELAAGETADVNFSSLGVTLTLTGDAPAFSRATALTNTGAINISASVVAGTANFSAATATTTYDTDGGVSNTAVTALGAVTPTSGISYDAASGLLHISLESDGANTTTIRNGTGSGVSFQIDGVGGFSEDGTSLADLEDGAAHFIEVQVGGEIVARVDLGIVTTTAAGTDSEIAIDIGEGLFSETAALTTGKDAAMNNYYTITDGSFEIRDEAMALLGTVNFTATDSLEDLAANITTNVTGVTAAVIENVIDNTFRIQILSSNHDPLNFVEVSGGLVAELNTANVGDGVFSANIGGSADGTSNGTVTVSSGRTMTATSLTDADGLKTVFAGTADVSGISLNYTVGVGAQMFGTIDELVDPVSGALQAEIDTFEDQNDVNQDRVDQMLVRLELERQRLFTKFVAMEAALASLENIKNSITELTDSLTSKR